MLRRTILSLLLLTTTCAAQISTSEAEQRLKAKLASRPATTRPTSELDTLRADNRRLREENAELTTEVSQLRDALAKSYEAASPSTRPATRPAAALNDQQSRLIGRWQGGELRSGNAFTTDFAADGGYHQSWASSAHRETGHWTLSPQNILEMWTTTGDNGLRNHWRASFEKDQLTLTPVDTDGTDIPAARPLLLQRVP